MNPNNPLARHSRAGGNPAALFKMLLRFCLHIAEIIFCRLDSRLRGNDTVIGLADNPA